VQSALPFQIPPALFPVEHLFLDLDGARIHYIHYIDEGAGDTLLLHTAIPLGAFYTERSSPRSSMTSV
jgi:hypothetical protein